MAWWFFQNAIVTAILALGVLVLCRFVRIGPVARHALWVLVLVKFVTPPVVVWPWPVPDPLGLAPVEVLSQVERVTPSAPFMLRLESAAEAPPAISASSPTPPAGSTPSIPLVVWVFALGAFGLIGLEGIRLVVLARRVRNGRPADPSIVSRVWELSRTLDLKPIPVVLVSGHASPMIWCFGRTRLLWPEDLDADSAVEIDACIDGLIVHELAHVKRRDHLVGWIELAAGVVWWWNPLFWFVRAAMREQAELACDAWVISTLPNGRRAYAESLLALSGAALRGTRPPRVAVLGIRASSRRVLERRLVMIMKGRVPLRLPLAGVFTIALVAAATLPAWATGQQPAPQAVPAAAPPATASPAVAAPAPQAPAVMVPVIQTTPAPPSPAVRPSTSPAPLPVPVLMPTEAAAQAQKVPPAAQPKPAQTPSRPKQVLPSDAWVPAQKVYYFRNEVDLPAEGKQLVTTYEADVAAIYKEIEAKVEARRQAAIKSLEALQEQFTKAGKLDEAVAIRDYLRAGGPQGNGPFNYSFFKKGGK